MNRRKSASWPYHHQVQLSERGARSQRAVSRLISTPSSMNYQSGTRFRRVPSVALGLQPNAFWNSGMFETVPFTRKRSMA